ncbi:conjugal transfer protein TraR [Candidatus Wolfebacteria bacterium CG10_big_fil_rev_8_21_14_0_10_31_9]|uniref:Conjugal transfer protein TraR n=1 Tax=Candidatus Wolfebacteria bacterium CG10_big_fil_rev_8_21_14_0_10_31_9 TaxID=1975070 RepID=A0A2H0REM2_9BACT|nr:MAG: conjugal transfer protein TraR [Candidatus Wolfebacteria bacterium CG10_big_fil_rev_8_21_14_0_10_31_9]
MNKEDLQKFKERLEKEKEELEKGVEKLKIASDFGDDTDSLEEETNESEEYGNQLALAQTFKEKVADINLALKKIEKGTYGICEKCGLEISLNILEVNQASRLCGACKKLSNN